MGSVNTEVVQIVTRHGEPSHPAICRPEPAAVRDIFDGLSGGPQGPGRLVTDLTPPHVWPTVTRISADPAPTLRFRCRVRNAFERWITKFSRMDPVKLAYLRTSFVFTVSVIVTWTPSSLNRVHDLLSRGHASFGLNLASAVVLPLQGLWNAIIFFTASWSPLREALLEEWDAMRGRPRGYRVAQSCQQEMQRQRTASLGRHRRNLSDYPGRIPDASGSDIGDLLRTATSSPVHLSASRNSTDTVHIFRDGRAALA